MKNSPKNTIWSINFNFSKNLGPNLQWNNPLKVCSFPTVFLFPDGWTGPALRMLRLAWPTYFPYRSVARRFWSFRIMAKVWFSGKMASSNSPRFRRSLFQIRHQFCLVIIFEPSHENSIKFFELLYYLYDLNAEKRLFIDFEGTRFWHF